MDLEKRSGRDVVRNLVAAVAGPREWSDNRKSWLARAARRAGITSRQAKSLFYGEITDPNHKAARLMRDAAELHANVAHGLLAKDPEFFSEHVAVLLELAASLRARDSGDTEI